MNQIQLIEKMRRRQRVVSLELQTVFPKDDVLSGGRSCILELTYPHHQNGGRPFDHCPTFRIHLGNSGMAFEETLRGYSMLFQRAADFVAGIEPIDFQI